MAATDCKLFALVHRADYFFTLLVVTLKKSAVLTLAIKFSMDTAYYSTLHGLFFLLLGYICLTVCYADDVTC